MIFSALRKYEVTVSYILTSVFIFVSVVFLTQYLNTLEEFSNTPPVTYAQSEEVNGVTDIQTSVTPTQIPPASPTIHITVQPSATSIPTGKPQQTMIQIAENNAENNPSTESNSSTAQTTAASHPEILQALNNYRSSKGIGPLVIDEKLQSFAQSRADRFASEGSMDNHAGFQSMLNDNGFEKMGFNALGENSSYGSWESPQFLIENLYGSSSAHNESQLRSDWTHVGIGVKDSATNLVFGGKKR